MTDYHFVSSWRLHSPIERVWDEIFHTERWPSWWKYVHRVEELDPGDAAGLGRRQHLVFTTRLPYRLGFDIRVRHLQPPTTLEAVATGELDGYETQRRPVAQRVVAFTHRMTRIATTRNAAARAARNIAMPVLGRLGLSTKIATELAELNYK